MDVHQKYELIELLPGEGPKSFRARQSSMARDVTVHVLVGGQTPENQGLLARLRALPPNSLARMVEVGTNNDGTQYVVIFAPPFQHLMEWLKDQEAAAIEAQRLTRAGAWKIPAPSQPAAAPPPVPPVAPGRPSPFADMFEAPQAMPTGQMMSSGAQQSPAPPVASEPGEFTRLFQTAAVPAAPPAAPAPPAVANIPQASLAPAAEPKPQPPATPPASPLDSPPLPPPVAAQPVPPPVASEPGEFTRLFQTAAVPAAAPAASTPPAIANIPQAPLAPAAEPKPQPPVRPPASPPASPPLPPPVAVQPVPPPVASEPGEFTRLFQASTVPAAAPAAPALPAAGIIPQPPLAPAAEPKPQPPVVLPASPPAPPPPSLAPTPVAPAPAPSLAPPPVAATPAPPPAATAPVGPGRVPHILSLRQAPPRSESPSRHPRSFGSR